MGVLEMTAVPSRRRAAQRALPDRPGSARDDVLAEALLAAGAVTPAQLDAARARQRQNPGQTLGQALQESDGLNETQLLDALCRQLGLRRLDPDALAAENEAAAALPQEMARRYGLLPVEDDGAVLTLAVCEPPDDGLIEAIRRTADRTPCFCLAAREPLCRAIARCYAEADVRRAARRAGESELTRGRDPWREASVDMTAAADAEAPMIALLNSLVRRAAAHHASDIHIEPCESSTRVRMRTDGVLRDYKTLDRGICRPLLSRIKVAANLDIAEQRLPQDGHIRAVLEDRVVNLRVSIMPTIYGEKAVLRLLSSDEPIANAAQLGMTDDDYRRFQPLLERPGGLVYLTGPTGSGKTTTLYMILETLGRQPLNIMTIEDPVERTLPRAVQTQVNRTAGLSFESGLRALLRQDPDVIAVGETRDTETAAISVRAAITGHRVFSTLHTVDALSAVPRLLDMGVERYLLADALSGVVAQRLLRRVCPHCAEIVPTTEAERDALAPDITAVRRGCGCPACGGTGYRGRVAVHELVILDAELRRLMLAGADLETMQAAARRTQGMRTLREAALDCVRRGETTPEELYRVIGGASPYPVPRGRKILRR